MTDEPLPANVPLTLIRGDTRIWTDTIKKNTGTDAAPVWEIMDLTGYTFLAQIRAGVADATGAYKPDRSGALKATLTVTSADPTTGVITLTLPDTEADGLDVTPCFWDLQLTRTSDSFRRTHLSGKVKVLGDVSNA